MSNFTIKQVCTLLNTQSSTDRQLVKDALADLQKQGEVFYEENDRRYNLVDGKNFGKAIFQGNKRGFGFLLREEGDLFVPAPKTFGAYHGDTVLYKRLPNTEDEAKVLAILERGKNTLVGTMEKQGNVGFVILDDQHFSTDIFVPAKRTLGAKNGQKVVVKIHSYPADNRNCPEGEVVQILGYPNENNVELMSVAIAYGVQTDFPENVQTRAGKIAQTLAAEHFAGCTITRSSRTLVEVVNERYSKGTAVKFIAEHYKIPLDKTIAVGDQQNDIPMVETAGLGIAVQNADERLQAVANYVTEATFNENAIAEIIHKFGFTE